MGKCLSSFSSISTLIPSMLQAAIHYHLPYSSLYGRINRLKREQSGEWSQFRDYEDPDLEDNESSNGGLEFR